MQNPSFTKNNVIPARKTVFNRLISPIKQISASQTPSSHFLKPANLSQNFHSVRLSRALNGYSRLSPVKSAFLARKINPPSTNTSFVSKLVNKGSNYLSSKSKLLFTDPLLFLAEVNPFIPSELLESGLETLGIHLATHPQYHPLMISTAINKGKLMNSSNNPNSQLKFLPYKSNSNSYRPFTTKTSGYAKSKINFGEYLNKTKMHTIKLKQKLNSPVANTSNFIKFLNKKKK